MGIYLASRASVEGEAPSGFAGGGGDASPYKSMELAASCEIFVSGHVQGVGYRYFTVEIATELDIKGYSKNLPDGSVYLEAEGEKEAILGFINHLWKGPRLARVSDIKVSWRDYRGIFKDFSVRH